MQRIGTETANAERLLKLPPVAQNATTLVNSRATIRTAVGIRTILVKSDFIPPECQPLNPGCTASPFAQFDAPCLASSERSAEHKAQETKAVMYTMQVVS